MKKGHQAIIVAESFTTNFKPLSHTRPKCLFPVANIPLLLFQIELLAQNNVTKIIIVSARDTEILKKSVNKIKSSHMKGRTSLIDFKFVKLARPSGLCEALRELSESVELNDDFILINGDIVSNADLSPALKQHYQSKQVNKDFQTVITKIFTKQPFSSPLRDPSQEIVLTVESETKQIVDYGQYQSNKQASFQINRKHINLKKQEIQYKLHVDIVDTEISVCSKELFKHLSEDIEIQ